MSTIVIDNVKARDLMSSNVLSVYEGWSIQRLADFFLNHKINGAPVIASDHQLVGVVSVSDIFRFENADDKTKSDALKSCYRDSTGMDFISQEDLRSWSKNAQQNCTVHQIMVNNIIAVDAEESLTEVTRLLVANEIHRIFVTNNKKIEGVISTTDILRTLVKTPAMVMTA